MCLGERVKAVRFEIVVRVLWIAAASAACQSVDPRHAVLEDMTERAITPQLIAFAERAAELDRALDALCRQPESDTLERARVQWRAARQAYKRTEAFGFGPVVTERIEAMVDFWPLRLDKVDAMLARSEPPGDAELASAGATVQGLPVIEYILFGGGSGLEPVARWLAQAPSAKPRCGYLLALGRRLRAQADKLLEAWSTPGGGYGRALAHAGRGSDVFASSLDAMSTVVNQLVALAESIASKKLGGPLGLKSGGAIQPELLESPYAGNAIADIRANIEGVRELYGATSAAALSYAQTLRSYARRRSPEVDARLVGALRDLEQALDEIGPSLGEALSQKPAAAELALERARALKRVIAVDLAGQLSATVTFTDNDGD